MALVVSLGEFGLLFALPLFLQATRGYDALETGVILLALAIGSFVASGLGAPLSQRMGPVRVLQLGMALEAIGIIGLGFVLSTTVTGWQMAPWLFVYGMGVGFATAQLTGVILSEVPVAESGQASAVQSTSRQVGAAIGTAIIGATLIFGLGSVASQLEDRGVPAGAGGAGVRRRRLVSRSGDPRLSPRRRAATCSSRAHRRASPRPSSSWPGWRAGSWSSACS